MKKGIVPLWISVVFSFMAVLLLILFFFIFLRGGRGPTEVAAQESYLLEAQQVLLNFLNTPIVYQGETILMADLVILSWQTKSTTALRAETEKFLRQSEFPFFTGKEVAQYIVFITMRPKPGSQRPPDLTEILCFDVQRKSEPFCVTLLSKDEWKKGQADMSLPLPGKSHETIHVILRPYAQ